MNRDELREALVLALGKADGQPWASLSEAPSRGEFMYGSMADALLAGPVGELQGERDQLRATLDAVREFAESFKHQWNHRTMTPTTFDRGVGAMAQDILCRILDGGEGGDRS